MAKVRGRSRPRARARPVMGAYQVLSHVDLPECSLRLLRLGGEKKVNLHYHTKCTQVYFVLQGTAEVTVGSDTRKLKARESIRAPARVPHGVRSDDRAIILSVSVPPLDMEDQHPVEEGYTKP